MYLSLDYGSDNCASIVMTVQVFPQSTLEASASLPKMISESQRQGAYSGTLPESIFLMAL